MGKFHESSPSFALKTQDALPLFSGRFTPQMVIQSDFELSVEPVIRTSQITEYGNARAQKRVKLQFLGKDFSTARFTGNIYIQPFWGGILEPA